MSINWNEPWGRPFKQRSRRNVIGNEVKSEHWNINLPACNLSSAALAHDFKKIVFEMSSQTVDESIDYILFDKCYFQNSKNSQLISAEQLPTLNAHTTKTQ